MSAIQSNVGLEGSLGMRVFRNEQKAPLGWRIRNWFRKLRHCEWWVPLIAWLARRLPGVTTMTSHLYAKVRKADGSVIDYGCLGRHTITTVGKGFVVDAWQNSVELEVMKYHGVGTGTTAAAAGDTALETESTTALNPDSTRATGSLTEASATVFQTVGTVTFDASAAITEWGLLSQAATGGGVLFDRQVFSALNMVSGDSIQFTYNLTVS